MGFGNHFPPSLALHMKHSIDCPCQPLTKHLTRIQHRENAPWLQSQVQRRYITSAGYHYNSHQAAANLAPCSGHSPPALDNVTLATGCQQTLLAANKQRPRPLLLLAALA